MLTLLEVLQHADATGAAVGHFNISELTAMKAVFGAAHEKNLPVVLGVSEGEREFMGVPQVAALVKSLREEYNFPVFLNADHTHSLAKAIEAAKAGVDWIVFDLSALPFEENVRQTKQAVEAVKAIRPSILVEGEIGDIGSGSEIHDSAQAPPGQLTTPDHAKQFVDETKVDTLAPAVGNRHGMTKNMVEGESRKHLNIPRIREIKEATKIFLTLHGASGTDDRDLRDAIAAGITVVHINTELRVAWRRGLDAALAGHPNEVVPYKLLPPVVDSVKQVVASRLALFSAGRELSQSRSAS